MGRSPLSKDGRTGAVLPPSPTKRGGGCSWGRRGEGAPPPPEDMNIYNGSGFLLHPSASRKPPQPTSLEESPQALKRVPRLAF